VAVAVVAAHNQEVGELLALVALVVAVLVM
jgi:hypothetical protein